LPEIAVPLLIFEGDTVKF